MKKIFFSSVFFIILIVFTQTAFSIPPLPQPTCNDNIRNQNETDVDCGGPCGPCPDGKYCQADSHCRSGYCNPNNKCASPSCNDGWRNGNETDIDCGGSCKKCPNEVCASDSDCATSYCNPNNRCSIPTCTDGFKNGYETGLDCGGNCKPCQNATTNKSVTSVSSISQPINLNVSGAREPASIAQGSNKNVEEATNQNKKNTSWALVAVISTIVILISSASLFFYNNIKKKSQGSNISGNLTNQKVGKDALKLREYVSNNLRAGYGPETIRQALQNSGWSEEEINRAFVGMRRW